MDKLAKAGVDAKYVEIDSEFGPSASGPEWRVGPALKAFLTRSNGSAADAPRAAAARPAMIR